MGYIIRYEDLVNMYDTVQEQTKGLKIKLYMLYKVMDNFVNNTDFSGNAVDSIKQYFNMVHMPMIKAFRESYEMYGTYIMSLYRKFLEVDSRLDAVIIEENLVRLSEKLQDMSDFITATAGNVNSIIDSVGHIVSISDIHPERYTAQSFDVHKEQIDTLNAKIKAVDQDCKYSELDEIMDVVDNLKTLTAGICDAGVVDIFEKNYGIPNIYEELLQLQQSTNRMIKEKENDMAVAEYLSRLAKADDTYDLREKIDWQFVEQVMRNIDMSDEERVSLSFDLVEGFFGPEGFIIENNLSELNVDAWIQWAYEYVPKHVNDASLIYVMTLMSTGLDGETVKRHLDHNRKNWIDHISSSDVIVDGYIDYQFGLTDMYYGINGSSITADDNTCEIIAMYNAMYYLNDGVDSPRHDFPEMIAQIESKGPCLNGYLGTSPVIMNEYMKGEGYHTKMIQGSKARNEKSIKKLQDDYETYIVTLYNDKNDLSAYIHTMCITKVEEDGDIKYILRNDYDEYTQAYDSISECLEHYKDGNSKTISIIGVNK